MDQHYHKVPERPVKQIERLSPVLFTNDNWNWITTETMALYSTAYWLAIWGKHPFCSGTVI